MHAPLDTILLVPPLSPSDTNPPLGPYILKSSFASAGLALEVLDLSVQYINLFKEGCGKRTDSKLGDQDKDRSATHAAREHFISACPLLLRVPMHVPCSAEPVLGMHYGFQEIHAAVTAACCPGEFWNEFLEQQLLSRVTTPPRILGLSIMGPPQLFVALVAARLAKRVWPDVLIVAGGSHVTLLAEEIARDARYGGDIDVFMTGHCEREFAELALRVRGGRDISDLGLRAGQGLNLACLPRLAQPSINGSKRVARADFELLPDIHRADLEPYDAERVTLPMQLTRGCSYGRCAYCTYPAVEPLTNATIDWATALAAIRTLVERSGVCRISFKDSLFTPRNLGKLAQSLEDTKLSVDWSATTLLNQSLTPELLGRIASAGCRTLEVGLETIDPVGQRLFNKQMDLDMIESVVRDACEANIVMVLNQIFGWPSQSLESARDQLAWYNLFRKRCPDYIHSSFNLLEINRASPMAISPDRYGIRLRGIAPWAFSYDWNAPEWRRELRIEIDRAAGSELQEVAT